MKRLVLTLFLIWVAVIAAVLYSLHKNKGDLEAVNLQLEQRTDKLKEELNRCNFNMSVICQSGMQGSPRYIHCGESFEPEFATCVCTNMCLEDYSLVMSNRQWKECRNWTFEPVKIIPADEDEDEEEDEEEEN